MARPTIEDFRPHTKKLVLHIVLTILLSLIFLGAIGYHIYAIYLNWEPLFLTYDEIYGHMDNIGGFFVGIVELIIAPFSVFITAFYGEGSLTGHPLSVEYMYAVISEIVLIVVSFIASGLLNFVFESNYDESKYNSYIETTTYFVEGGSTFEQSHYVSASSQASGHASWITDLVMLLLIFIAPVSTIVFMVIFVSQEASNAYSYYENYKKQNFVYKNLKEGKLKIRESEKKQTKKVEKEYNPDKEKEVNTKLAKNYKEYRIMNILFFTVMILVGVIGITTYVLGSLDKVKTFADEYKEIIGNSHYNDIVREEFIAHFHKYSSGTIMGFGIINSIAISICGITGLANTIKKEYCFHLNLSLVLGIIFMAIGLFIQFVNPLTYFESKETLTYHSINVIAAIIAFFLIFIPIFYVIDSNAKFEYVLGPAMFILSIILVLLSLTYFNLIVPTQVEMELVQPDLFYMNIYLLSLLALNFLGLYRTCISNMGYNAEYLKNYPYSNKASEIKELIEERYY